MGHTMKRESPFLSHEVQPQWSTGESRVDLSRLLRDSPFGHTGIDREAAVPAAWSGEMDEAHAVESFEWEQPQCYEEQPEESAGESWFEAEAWSGSTEQIAFRDRVLAAHIARSRAARGAPLRDLAKGELALIPGTEISTLPATAGAAGRLLAAANAALQLARQRGDADALRTIRLSATSGYRGSDVQRKNWLNYFSARNGYYDRTQAARDRIPAGPHSNEAVAYMLKSEAQGGFGLGGRVAAPGYSNHQNGIAIDWWQQRDKGHAIANKSDKQSRARWRGTWFHKWLLDNAVTYHFRPLATEEWHWEYRPSQAAQPQGSRDHLGGKLWTFKAKALPLQVAVFCPKSALGRSDVEVLLFAHGLVDGCRKPKSLPNGFITDAPFSLGRIVDASARPMVLVVPLLDWNNPGGEAAFGTGRGKWHALAQPAMLNAVLAEVLVEVGRVQARNTPALRELMVAGHSRAFDFLEPLAHSRADPQMRLGALSRLTRIWAFDTTYAGDVSRWVDWLKRDARLQVAFFYQPLRVDARKPEDRDKPSGTATIGRAFHAKRSARLAVTSVTEGHCSVPARQLPALLTLAPLQTQELDSQASTAESGNLTGELEGWLEHRESMSDASQESAGDSMATQQWQESVHATDSEDPDTEQLDPDLSETMFLEPFEVESFEDEASMPYQSEHPCCGEHT
jgi:hypothetical protein